MKLRSLWLVPLMLPLLGAFSGSFDDAKLVPRKGLSLTKTFEMEAESESQRTSSRGSDTTSSSTSTSTLVVTDTLEEVEDDRILKLVRSYDEVGSLSEYSFEFRDTSRESSTEGTSEVDGTTVTFEWDEDEEEYVPSSDDLDEDVLADLQFDLHFSGLLPDGEASEGDDWEIDIEAFEALTNPWEGLPWEWEGSDGVVRSSEDSDDSTETETTKDGEVSATYEVTRDEDGVLVAVIKIEGELEIESSMSSEREMDQGTSTMEREMTETRTIEGEALWHIEGGHLHSMELRMEVEANGTTSSVFSFGDREFESESEEERTGVMTYKVTVEEAE